MSETAAFFWSLVQEQPDSAELRCHFAQALLDGLECEAAIQAASIAIERDASFVEAWLTRGKAYGALGRWAEAAKDYKAASRLAPHRLSILIGIAACCTELSYLEEAESWLRQAVQLDPGNKEAQTNLGSILVRLERLAEAERPCRAALAIDSGILSAHQNLSAILADRDPEAALLHRHHAYRQQQVFIEPAIRERHAVLVLAAADAANVPLRHLLPRSDFTIIRWYIEYALPGQFESLPPHQAVFNSIGDADFIPILGRDTAEHLHAVGKRMLNPLEQVAATARDKLPGLLQDIVGIVVPRTIRVGQCGIALSEGGLSAAIQAPVLVRPVGSHGGVGVMKADTLGTANHLLEAGGYVTEFVDFQSRDGWYRKYRVIFVDSQAFPYHLAVSTRWLVHYWTAGMEHDPVRRAEEEAFLAKPGHAIGDAAWDAVKAIGQRLGLDYGGIDFGVLADGRVVVFEANATMLVHPEPDAMFAYRRDAIEAIQRAFGQMINDRCLRPIKPRSFSSNTLDVA